MNLVGLILSGLSAIVTIITAVKASPVDGAVITASILQIAIFSQYSINEYIL